MIEIQLDEPFEKRLIVFDKSVLNLQLRFDYSIEEMIFITTITQVSIILGLDFSKNYNSQYLAIL